MNDNPNLDSILANYYSKAYFGKPSIKPEAPTDPVNDVTRLLPNNIRGASSKRYCYWTVADGNHGLMAKTLLRSMRQVGVKEDFHIWTDHREIDDAKIHSCGSYDKTLYMFKFHFLRREVKHLDYDYFIFLDADNYFVRHPGDLSLLINNDNKIFVQMENQVNSPQVKRDRWWGCPIAKYINLIKKYGSIHSDVWNCNAGFWIVRKVDIDSLCDLAEKFYKDTHALGLHEFTEEPCLALLGHVFQNPYDRTLDRTSWLWGSDWTGQWSGRLPENKAWQFEDYLSGEKLMVHPAIVHCMRSKEAMLHKARETKSNEPIIISNPNRENSKFEILLCCYGNYPNVSIKTIQSILSTQTTNIKIRVALNDCCKDTTLYYRKLFDNKQIETLLEFNTNINKDPAMRKLIDCCQSEYFLWLDDDTYPNKMGWDKLVNDFIANNKFDVGGFPHVSGRGGYALYKDFLEQRPWFKSWDKYKEYKDPNFDKDNIPFPIGFLWVGRTEYFRKNDFPDRSMIKKCDDMLLGEMLYQTNGTLIHMGQLWDYFNRNDAPRRGNGEEPHDGWVMAIKNIPRSKHTITIYPTGGMCNRLRNIITAYELCKEKGYKLKVIHETSPNLVAGIKFDDYWVIPNDIEYENKTTDEIMEIHNREKTLNNIYLRIPVEKIPNGVYHNHWGLCILENETIENQGLQRLIRGLKGDSIALKPRWKQIVESFVKDNNIQNCIGIHLRSFEFLFGERKQEQNDKMIENFINNLSLEGAKIYLATDSRYVQTQMMQRLGKNCIWFKNIANDYLLRTSVSDFEHGLIDFYILSNCQKVLGTKGSSYSHLAGLLSGSLQWVAGAREAKEWDG